MPKRSLLAIIFFLIFLASSCWATNYYPYSNFILRTPGIIEPFPGFGDYYSSLGRGLSTAMWNPASLAHVDRMELNLGISQTSAPLTSNQIFYTTDGTLEFSGTSTTGLSANYLFSKDLTDPDIKQRSWIGALNYSTINTGLQAGEAIKVSDWLCLGVTNRGESGADLNVSGSFPMQLRAKLNLTNSTDFLGTGINIGADGKITYAHTLPDGSKYTVTSEATVWNSFLNQDQRIPLSVETQLRNSLNVKADMTITSGFTWKGIAFGVNVTPISASTSVDNVARAIIASDVGDRFFYTPDFDPSDQAAVTRWMTSEASYGTSDGYKKKYIRVPSGEDVGEARYQGFFEASTIRFDVGALYDVNPNFTVGISYENLNGARLDFKGLGRNAFVQSRLSTAEIPSSLIDPNSSNGWEPFTDEYATLPGTENLGMMENIPIELPRKLRMGFTLRKPILVSLDYEQQFNSLSYRAMDTSQTYTDVTINNISLIRLGAETRVFALPWWLRLGMVLMPKPTVSGLDTATKKSFDAAFKYKVLPLKVDLGTNFELWDTQVGGSLGVNGTSIFSLMQLDTLNTDLTRTAYYSLYVNKDNWGLNYNAAVDLGATASAYDQATNKNDYWSYIKWVSTLAMKVKF